MPIKIDYSWDETREAVNVTCAVKRSLLSALDVYVADCLVKLNCPPYFLQLDLAGVVDPGTAVVVKDQQGQVRIKLTKAEPGLWGDILTAGDPAAVIERREASVARKNAAYAESHAESKKVKNSLEKLAFNRAWDIEAKQKKNIELLKEQDKREALADVYEWADGSRHAEEENTALNGKLGSATAAPAYPVKQRTWDNHVEHKTVVTDVIKGASAKEQTTANSIIKDKEPVVDMIDCGAPHCSNSIVRKDAFIGRDWKPYCSKGCYKGNQWETKMTEDDEKQKKAEKEVEFQKKRDAVMKSAQKQAAKDKPRYLKPAKKPSEIWDGDVTLPPVRSAPGASGDAKTAKVNIKFTKMGTRLAAREGKIQANMNARTKKRIEPDWEADGLDEREPSWLKDKGDSMFKTRDYPGAVNAYSAAIYVDPRFAAAYLNRAAVYLMLDEYVKTVEDCTDAMVYMLAPKDYDEVEDAEGKINIVPKEGEKPIRSMIRCLVRRGTAFHKQNLWAKAKADFDDALKLNADSPDYVSPEEVAKIKADSEQLKSVLETKDEAIRKMDTADDLYKTGKTGEAMELYNEILDVVPESYSALMNRAACSQIVADWGSVERDTTLAINILDPPAVNDKIAVLTPGMIAAKPAQNPNDIPEKTRKTLSRAFARRGHALVQSDRLIEAADDYRQAEKFNPTDKKIKAECQRVCELEKTAYSERGLMGDGASSGKKKASNLSRKSLAADLEDGREDDSDDGEDDDDDEDEDEDEDEEEVVNPQPQAMGVGIRHNLSTVPEPAVKGGFMVEQTGVNYKKEGDKLAGAGEWEAASQAFTRAIDTLAAAHQTCPAYSASLTNRSVCNMCLCSYQACVDDCTVVLQLLSTSKPGLPAEYAAAGAESLAKAVKLLARRGTAHAQVGRIDEAELDYEQAAALDPANTKLQDDLAMIRASNDANID